MNNSNLYIMNLIKLYLKAYKIAFNDKELYKVLVTDPDFPSLASVSRTLNYYGLSSDAYLLDKLENVTSLKGKLVHSSLNGGHFFVVKKQSEDSLTLFDGKSYSLPVNEFLKVWDGVALMVKEPKNVNAFHRGWLSTQSWMAFLALLLSNFVSLYFQKQKKSFENEVQLLRFKRNHAVYKALSNDCTIGDGLGMYGIQFGDKGASCKIRMVVSLDCKFCRKAIREAASLIKRFPQRFSCEVILADGSSLVEGLNGYVANRLREFNIIQEYYRGNRNMSILEKLSSKDISEKLELASVISQYKKNQKIIKELSIEKLPLIQINGKNKSSDYDISDYQYMDEI